MKASRKREKLIHCVIIICLVSLALLIRAPGLGKWCFAVDEYYFSRSVSFILEKGVPEFPGGGYYVRGIALQYLTAGTSLLFEKPEFAARVVPLVFGVLSIPLFFILCRFFLPVLPALFCSVVLVLSSWHIEFSRFARMYAPFQFLFFAFLYSFYIGFWKGSKKHRKTTWILAFVAIFIYEGSIFLPLILFLPFIVEDFRVDESKTVIVCSILILLFLNFVAHKVNYRDLGVTVENIPPELKYNAADIQNKFPIYLPGLELFWALWKSKTAAICYLFTFGGFLFFFRDKIFRKKAIWMQFITIVAIGLPLFHQFGLLFSLLLILFLFRSDVKKTFFDEGKFWVSYIVAFILFWVAFGYGAKSFWFSAENGSLISKDLIKSLFLYPPIHADILFPFVREIPIWTVFAFLLIFISLTRILFFHRNDDSRFILIIIVFCSLVIMMLKKPYHDTRYFFFFFPLLIILAYIEIGDLRHWLCERMGNKARGIIAGSAVVLPFVLFLVTEDFNLLQVVNTSSPLVNFRMEKYEQLAGHWYPRADFRNPAEYVNGKYNKGDVIVLDYSPMSYYIDRPFVNFISPMLRRFRGQARKRGTEEMWTGQPLIYDIDKLIDAVPNEKGRSMWLVSIVKRFGGGSFTDENHPLKLAKRYDISVNLEYVGIDGRIGVWKIQRVNG